MPNADKRADGGLPAEEDNLFLHIWLGPRRIEKQWRAGEARLLLCVFSPESCPLPKGRQCLCGASRWFDKRLLIGIGPPAQVADLLGEHVADHPGISINIPGGTGAKARRLLEDGLIAKEWDPWTLMWCAPTWPGGKGLVDPPGPPLAIVRVTPDDPGGQVAATLDLAFPDASTRPGDEGVTLWMAAREGDDPRAPFLGVVALEAGMCGRPPLIASLAVIPEARRRGVGGKLLVEAARQALVLSEDSQRPGAVFLGVYSSQASTIALYERLGFVKERECDCYQARGPQ